ncbi:chemotaxis protein CheA [Paragemmobacter straminiformis]|uniref:Chemotaxis protein CheA n=1 Tax=Paragemmobacter straminiformis TaxID=2045119 RepID=A0A842I3Y4_9RHOB|nr:chemotaxis protein CheA [Gemmobacter straminiformis]MBC2834137.1 chemotaxis protein CheA [Gemmobacter straminiformis]
MVDDELAGVFREELRDLLDSLERGLLDLKAAPQDMGLVNQVFRDLHTVKGSGAMFGFVELAAFIHRFETLFDKVRAGEVPVSAELIRLALAARDEIPGLVDGVADPEGRRDAILSGLAALGCPVAEAAPVAAAVAAVGGVAPQAAASLTLEFRLLGEALGLGARPEVVLGELRALGAGAIVADLADVPPLDLLEPDACHIVWRMVLPGSVTEAQVEDVFLFTDAEWKLTRDWPESGGFDFELGAAGTELPAVEDAAVVAPVATPVAAPAATPAVAPVLQAVPAAEAVPAAVAAAAATIRVPAERLDALMDAVGELVIVEARLTELARQSRDPALMTTAEQITRLAAGLRDATMTMRMVPMRSLVGRFRRLISGLSDSLGKPVAFNVLGEDTELDKTVIEKLADPLVHVLRNAIDHGMETQDERAAKGKSGTGIIELSAQHAGAEVLIRVRDDGRGMDPARIRAKAVSQGIIAPEAVLTEAQTFALVFEPGFSTATEVTELSGRGVGMDVVRRTIEGLRGSIEIDSKLGSGTSVTLRLPLTLAIIEGLLIEVAGEKYTLPMAMVQEIVALPKDRAEPKRSGDFLDIRGKFVPFLRLRSLFDCAGSAPGEQNVVIVSSGETRVGIVVDRIVGTNQTVIKQMSKLHAGVRAVSGATILGDGSVALILDVGHLIGLGRGAATQGMAFAEVAA